MIRSRTTRPRRAAPLALALLLCAAPARAHDPHDWINRGQYRSLAGDLCCGKDDCFEVRPERVLAHRDGVRLPDHGDLIVPGREIQVSEDGKYWLCKVGARMRCFFAPYHGN